MKRIWKRLPVLVLLTALLIPPAFAVSDENAALVSQFQQNGFLYVFTAFEEWPDGLSARLRSGDLARDIPSAEQPQRVADNDTPVSYLLLVDCSTSMARFQNRVVQLSKRLAEADETGASFAVATFGEIFKVAGCDLSGNEMVGAIEAINYIAQRTDISQGVLDAAEYLRTRQRQAGELVNLVVITDGIPMYDEGSPELTEVARALEDTPSVLVHTVGFGGSKTDLQLLASLGRGLHVPGQESRGADIAKYVNDLCTTRFPWELKGLRSAAEIQFTWSGEGEALLPLDLNQAALPSDGAETSLEGSIAPAPSQEITPAPSEVLETSPAVSDKGAAETAPPIDGTNVGNKKDAVTPLIWVVLAAVLAFLLAAFLFYRMAKGKKRHGAGIPMRLEVISGTLSDETDAIVHLEDELTIGSSGRCDIIWKDKDVSPRNSRIFLKEQMIYIEDLGSSCGTALGGMRLHCPNRLRSGDEISIGHVRFVLKF